MVHHGDSSPLRLLPAERITFGLWHHNLSWGSGFDSKPMIISFQCKRAARDVSTIISSPVTEAQQRRGAGAEPGREAALHVSLLQRQPLKTKVPCHSLFD